MYPVRAKHHPHESDAQHAADGQTRPHPAHGHETLRRLDLGIVLVLVGGVKVVVVGRVGLAGRYGLEDLGTGSLPMVTQQRGGVGYNDG
jgi:hypothetical protein